MQQLEDCIEALVGQKKELKGNLGELETAKINETKSTTATSKCLSNSLEKQQEVEACSWKVHCYCCGPP
jgi:hypothetical protein